MEKNDLTLLNDDQQLQADIKNGVYSVEQVADIWRKTEDLSPQTNINARRMVIAIREAGKGRGPIEALAVQFPLFVNEMLRIGSETQAALMRDESKFAHLVAGAEMVAKSMEQFGHLATFFEDHQQEMRYLRDEIAEMRNILERDTPKPKRRWWQFWKYIPNWRDHEPEGDELPDEQDHAWARETIGRNMMPEEAIPTDDERAEKARKRTIGSAWINRMPD